MLLIGCAARAADLLWLCGARLLRLLLLRVICTAAANPAQQTDETVSDGRRAKVVAVGYTHRVCGRFSEERWVSFLNLIVSGSGAASPSDSTFLALALAFLLMVLALGLRPAPGL